MKSNAIDVYHRIGYVINVLNGIREEASVLLNRQFSFHLLHRYAHVQALPPLDMVVFLKSSQ